TLDNASRIEVRALEQRSRGRQRIGTAGADRRDVMIGLDHVAVSGDHENLTRIGDQQQCFQAPQITVRTPVFTELDRSAGQLPVLLELAFEALKERKSIGGTACKTREHFIVVKAADLARVALHDSVAESDLSVTSHCNCTIAADGDNSGPVGVESLALAHWRS